MLLNVAAIIRFAAALCRCSIHPDTTRCICHFHNSATSTKRHYSYQAFARGKTICVWSGTFSQAVRVRQSIHVFEDARHTVVPGRSSSSSVWSLCVSDCHALCHALLFACTPLSEECLHHALQQDVPETSVALNPWPWVVLVSSCALPRFDRVLRERAAVVFGDTILYVSSSLLNRTADLVRQKGFRSGPVRR